MRLALVLLLILGVIGVLLATQDANLTNEVRLALPFTDADWTGPVLWMIGGWFGAGLLLGYLVALPGRVGASMRARKIEKQLGTTEVKKDRAVHALNESAPLAASRTAPATEADEMQRLADEVARRTESVQQAPPPPKV